MFDCRSEIGLHVGVLGDKGEGKEPTFILYLRRLGNNNRRKIYFHLRKALNKSYLFDSRVDSDYLSWNCVEGTRAARRLQSPTLLACHQVASSWLTT